MRELTSETPLPVYNLRIMSTSDSAECDARDAPEPEGRNTTGVTAGADSSPAEYHVPLLTGKSLSSRGRKVARLVQVKPMDISAAERTASECRSVRN